MKRAAEKKGGEEGDICADINTVVEAANLLAPTNSIGNSQPTELEFYTYTYCTVLHEVTV